MTVTKRNCLPESYRMQLTNQMEDLYKQLRVACAKSGISISDFSRKLGKSRTAIKLVATGKATSKPILSEIERFIADQGAFVPASVIEMPGMWLTTADFARRTGMRPESVANKCRLGGFKLFRREGKKWLIHRSELEAAGVKA